MIDATLLRRTGSPDPLAAAIAFPGLRRGVVHQGPHPRRHRRAGAVVSPLASVGRPLLAARTVPSDAVPTSIHHKGAFMKAQETNFRRTRLWTIVLVAAVGLAGAACSSDSTSTTVTTAGAPGATEASNVTEPTTGTTLADNVATGEPVKIGFVNNEGDAAFSAPELTVGSRSPSRLRQPEARRRQRAADRGGPLRQRRIARAVDRLRQQVHGGERGGRAGRGRRRRRRRCCRSWPTPRIPLVGHVQFGPARMFDLELVLLRDRGHRLRRRVAVLLQGAGRDVDPLVLPRRHPRATPSPTAC